MILLPILARPQQTKTAQYGNNGKKYRLSSLDDLSHAIKKMAIWKSATIKTIPKLLYAFSLITPIVPHRNNMIAKGKVTMRKIPLLIILDQRSTLDNPTAKNSGLVAA